MQRLRAGLGHLPGIPGCFSQSPHLLPSSKPLTTVFALWFAKPLQTLLSELVFSTPPMKYIKWSHLVLHILSKCLRILLSPFSSGKIQRRETRKVWWRWWNSPRGVQIETSHGTVLATAHTAAHASGFPWCLGCLSQDAEGHVCFGFYTNSERPGPFHLCSLELDPVRDGFLSSDQVVIKIPTNSSFSTIYNTWRRSFTLKQKGQSGNTFFLYLDKSTIDLSGG